METHASQGVKDFLKSQGLFEPVGIFVFAPGAFIVLAFVVAFINHRNIKKAQKTGGQAKLMEIHDCASCELDCAKRVDTAKAEKSVQSAVPQKEVDKIPTIQTTMQSMNDELDKLESEVKEG